MVSPHSELHCDLSICLTSSVELKSGGQVVRMKPWLHSDQASGTEMLTDGVAMNAKPLSQLIHGRPSRISRHQLVNLGRADLPSGAASLCAT